MTKAKRPYVPKVKGCYECSQRRVHCDRQEPSCAKCVARGLHCSGLGIRYRFSSDAPSRLNLIEQQKAQSVHCNDTNHQPTDLLWEYQSVQHGPSDPGLQACHSKNDSTTYPEARLNFMKTALFHFHLYNQDGSDEDNVSYNNNNSLSALGKQTYNERSAVEDTQLSIFIPDNIIDSWKLHLLSHFAHRIAPELVVLDDQQNGWRHLVLPVACFDDLVMDAVLSAAAFHFAANNIGNQLYKPEAIYARAIQRLQDRQNLAAQDKASNQAVILALLVMLSTAMVNGCTDFPTIFRLLETAAEAMGGDEAFKQGELGNFIVRHMRKYRGYASPLLSREQGLARLSLTTTFGQHANNGWDDFKFAYQSHPEFSQSLSTIYNLNKQACDIYVARMFIGANGAPLTNMVEQFISTLHSITDGTPGEHTLVFATFIAAAEAHLPEHRLYFTQALMKHYERNGFANILRALDYLETIWSGNTTRDWTQILPTLNVFVV